MDSALNSFGIAGGATEAARGWAMATWESEEASLAERQAWTQPQWQIWTHTKRNHNSLQNPSKNQTSIGNLGRGE